LRSLLVSLLPLIIGSAVVPVQIIMAILLLTSPKQGPAKAIGFVAGMTLVRLAQGVIFGLILTGGGSADASEGSGWIKSTLMLVLGILLLITAYKNFANDPDPDAPPPRWLAMLTSIGPLGALAMGAGLILIGAKLWVFTLGALGTIGEAQLGQPASTIAFLLYVLLAQSLLIMLILIRLIFPARASVLLGSLGDWLEAHNSQIVIVVSLVFGLLFLYQGVTGLFA
jgi:hypothetical protein